MTTDKAWEIYCRRGVIVPGYAGVIAERRRLQHEWSEQDQPLQ